MTQMLTLSGIPAGAYAFGTMQFGGNAGAEESQEMYDACRAAGIAHYDTANVYTEGASETLLGAMIAKERETVFVATKAGYTGGAGAANLKTQFDVSRRRLDADVVDLLYLHRFDPNTDLRETMQAFAELKDGGMIRYVGLSNFAAWQVVKANQIAGEFGISVDALQPMYNLVKRQAEVEILPMCEDQGITPVPYSPLGGGLLTGKYADGGSGRLSQDHRYAARYGQDWMHLTARALSALAADRGVSPATLAVAWVAAHPTAPIPIISARSVAQLGPSLSALSYNLDPELYEAMSELSPRPAPATDRLEEQA
ncbi:MAG: aldo/keto reductase [Pseudomonadota bacterium]